MTVTLLQSPSLCDRQLPTREYQANGLTIVAEQVPVEAVNLSVWLNVGSAVEADAINGMAHFLEHMVFKGTTDLPHGEFEHRIEQRGAITNAMTSQDYTHYYITTAPQDFAALAPLQFEVLLNASIPDYAFERERQVVLEETRRSEDNPRRRTFQQVMQTTFEQLPYRRPVLGTVDVLQQLTPQEMRDFHSTWYRPSIMTVAAVGNLPVEDLISTVAASFDRLDQGQSPAALPQRPLSPEYFSPEAPFTTVVRREQVDPSLHQARLVMSWRVPGLCQLEQTFALDVLATLLGQGKTSRLVQDLREDKQLVSQILASNLTYGLQGVFYVAAQLPLENLNAVELAIAQHLERLRNDLVAVADLARVCTQVANRFVFSNETPSDRANLYGYYQSLVGDLAPALDYPAQVQALDVASLQAAAQQYLTPDAYGLVILRPPD